MSVLISSQQAGTLNLSNSRNLRPPAPRALLYPVAPPAVQGPGRLGSGTGTVAAPATPRGPPVTLRFVVASWLPDGKMKPVVPTAEVYVRIDDGNFSAEAIYRKLSIAAHRHFGRGDADEMVPFVACHGNGAVIHPCAETGGRTPGLA